MFNKELIQFYIYRAITGISLSLITLFVPIYLYQLGFSLGKIILFFFFIALYFFVLILFTPIVVTKFGIRHSMLFSVSPLILYYLGLNYIQTYPILFFILPFFIALSDSLLWIGYHIYFLKYSKKDERGKQLSLNYIITLLTSVLGPLFGALLITILGYGLTYTIGAGLVFLSIIPLFLSKEFKRKPNFSHKDLFNYLLNKKNVNLNLSFVGYSVDSEINRVLWPIFIFIILQGVLHVGFIVSLTTFVSIVIIFIMGRLTDIKNKKSLIKIGAILNSLAWFFRIFVNTKLKIFLVDTFKTSSFYILRIPWEPYAYDLSKRRNYFEYFVAREMVFKGVRLIVFPLVILIFYLLPIKTAFISIFVISGLVSLLYTKIKG